MGNILLAGQEDSVMYIPRMLHVIVPLYHHQ